MTSQRGPGSTAELQNWGKPPRRSPRTRTRETRHHRDHTPQGWRNEASDAHQKRARNTTLKSPLSRSSGSRHGGLLCSFISALRPGTTDIWGFWVGEPRAQIFCAPSSQPWLLQRLQRLCIIGVKINKSISHSRVVQFNTDTSAVQNEPQVNMPSAQHLDKIPITTQPNISISVQKTITESPSLREPTQKQQSTTSPPQTPDIASAPAPLPSAQRDLRSSLYRGVSRFGRRRRANVDFHSVAPGQVRDRARARKGGLAVALSLSAALPGGDAVFGR